MNEPLQPASSRWPVPRWAWAALAAVIGATPFAQGFTGGRIFYIRDLSLFFWGRFLWLRRSMLAGEWPFWDPYVGAGQAAYQDALHQMFLLPVLAVRLIGSETFAFNLWVALPFPLAAIGAFGFFQRRFSHAAAALGATAFTLAGPVTSTGNFPNMSWSVAAIPWVLWTVDRVAAAPTRRSIALLAVAVGFQALAGEPVTLFSTLLVSMAFAVVVGASPSQTLNERARRTFWVGVGVALGLAVATVQLLPMAQAAAAADRSGTIGKDMWSLHPLALLETICLHLFGNYYTSQSLLEVPWMRPLNSGREPFFFSIYFGVPLLTCSLFGVAAGGPRRWSTFWTCTGAAALIGAFGAYTPIYPFLRDHLPLLSSFRFPVKYLVIIAMAIAAGAAAGWDALGRARADRAPSVRFERARKIAAATAVVAGAGWYAIAALCVLATNAMAFRVLAIARAIGVVDPIAAVESMFRTLPAVSTALMLVSIATAGLVFVGAGDRRRSAFARIALYVLVIADLLIRAWGLNPAFDPAYVAEPKWLALTRTDPNTRFYVGGKRDGTLDPDDFDSSPRFLNPPGLRGSASRAALSGQTVYYPSAFRARELLSYDLAVLWPKRFQLLEEQFFTSGPAARARFLDRAGIRFRILRQRTGDDRPALAAIPYYEDSFLFDWGADKVAPRAAVVRNRRVIPEATAQIDAMFEPGWDHRTTVLIDRDLPATGAPGAPVVPFARLVADQAARVVIEAGAAEGGGYLVLLDSFANGWSATVDGQPATIALANGTFRAVAVTPGPHTIEFVYRPPALGACAAVSALALVIVLVLGSSPRVFGPMPRSRSTIR